MSYLSGSTIAPSGPESKAMALITETFSCRKPIFLDQLLDLCPDRLVISRFVGKPSYNNRRAAAFLRRCAATSSPVSRAQDVPDKHR